MSYQALYRVWRPQVFSDLVGQEFITKTLKNALLTKQTTHAYLFTGPRGTGKTSAAKIFAKAINCQNQKDGEPCNQCETCKAITAGRLNDVIEIDAASNNGVEEIRDIRDKAKYAPTQADYKVYIIDEVHMLSTGAFNALLKTLEEPPEYAIIILITNNKESLLPTIKSRCEIIKFLPISIMELKKYLIDRGVEEKRSALLANFSRGSIEKALELSESSDFSIMRDDIQKYIQDILDKNMVEILNISSDMDKYKDKVIIVLDMMINYFRDIMICKDRADKDMLINGDRITFIQNMSSKITYSQVSKIIDIIEEAKRKMRSNCNFSVSIQVMALNIYEVIK